MVKFRHAYLQIPVVSVDEKIINRLQVMAGALQNAPTPTCSNQLNAIDMLRTLFEKWKLLASPALLNDSHAVCLSHASPPPSPCRVHDTTPSPNCTNSPFHVLENKDNNDTPSATTWSPPPLPASIPQMLVQCARVTPFQQGKPMRLVFNDIASTSVSDTTPQLPLPPPPPRASKPPSPVVHHTRSCLAPL